MAADDIHERLPPTDAPPRSTTPTDRDEGTPATGETASGGPDERGPEDNVKLQEASDPRLGDTGNSIPVRDEETAPRSSDDAAPAARGWEDTGLRLEAHSPADLPAGVRNQLDIGRIEAMMWPVIYESGPAHADETFVSSNYFHWSGDAETDAKRLKATTLSWAAPIAATSDDQVIDSVKDITSRAKADGLTVSVSDIMYPPTLGPDGASGVDVNEKYAIKPEFKNKEVAREESRNARFTLTIPAGTYREIIYSKAAPQESEVGKRKGPDAFPGGAEQVLILDYDRARCPLSVVPVGEWQDLSAGGANGYHYADRPGDEEDAPRRPRVEERPPVG